MPRKATLTVALLMMTFPVLSVFAGQVVENGSGHDGLTSVRRTIEALGASGSRIGSDSMALAAPMGFTENLGQVDNREVLYSSTFGGLQIGLLEGGALLKVSERASPLPDPLSGPDESVPSGPDLQTHGVLVRITFDGANPVRPMGRGELAHASNYLRGNRPAGWKTNVRSYREVVYLNLYDGIDLVYRATSRGAKYEFLVEPGANPAAVRMTYEGVGWLSIEGGDLVVHTASGDLRDSTPYGYQGSQEVACQFAPRGLFSVGFSCPGWDSSRPLVIDPLVYATFLGGAGNDQGFAIAVDAGGDAYIAGNTTSTDFPTSPGAFDTSRSGPDAFVAKLNATGDGLVYATFLGGSGSEQARSIALDSLGNVYVTGFTDSPDFPITAGAFDLTLGWVDAFVAKLDASGTSLVYSTFLGGSFGDQGLAIAVDASGNAYVTGATISINFPTTPGAFQPMGGFSNQSDGFVAKLNAAGSGLAYATYLGGSASEGGLSIAVDPGGNAIVSGVTGSLNFPVTAGAFDLTLDGSSDAFVAKLNPTGSALAYATYLGGSNDEGAPPPPGYLPPPPEGNYLAIDASGAVYVAGVTASPDFPITAGAFRTALNGGTDAFAVKLNASGSSLDYATFLGGSGDDRAHGLIVDGAGNAYLTGETGSADFPTTPGTLFATHHGGATDAFLAKLSSAGNALTYATFLGGQGDDIGISVAIDGSRTAYVTGATDSADLRTTAAAFDTSYNGRGDAFVAKLDLTTVSNAPPTASFDISPGEGDLTTSFSVDASASSDPEDPTVALEVRWDWNDDGIWDTSWSATKTSKNRYIDPGIYTIRVEVRDTGGLTNSSTKQVQVKPFELSISATPTGETGLTQSFSVIPSAGTPPFSFLWDFGDGETSTLASPTHTYSEPGVFTVAVTVTDAEGRSATTTFVLHIEGRPPGPSLPPGTLLLAGLLLISSALAGLEYTRLMTREEVLQRRVRCLMFEYIKEKPGASFVSVRDGLGLQNGVTAYHLWVLERQGLVHSESRRGRRWYYPNGDVSLWRDLPVSPLQTSLMQEVRQRPGIGVRELARAVGRGPSSVAYNVHALAREGILRTERAGRKMICFAGEEG